MRDFHDFISGSTRLGGSTDRICRNMVFKIFLYPVTDFPWVIPLHTGWLYGWQYLLPEWSHAS